MRIGIVCPYSFDIPGGVQSHILQLAESIQKDGYYVSVITPSSSNTKVPKYVLPVGKSISVPYNGSVARLQFGLTTHCKIKKWITDNKLDILHLHEPSAPSLSMLALCSARIPIISTFHTSIKKSWILNISKLAMKPFCKKIVGRIAVSELARHWQEETLGSNIMEIPNGVDIDAFRNAPKMVGYPRPGYSILFLGRFEEPRKGMAILLSALSKLVQHFENIEILVAGSGDNTALKREAGSLKKHFRFLGQIDDKTKAVVMRSADIYCAPNLGGESFGIVLIEAMAAQTPIVASNLNAFKSVLAYGQAGKLFPVGDSNALASALINMLNNKAIRKNYIQQANLHVLRYDWSVISKQITRMYESSLTK